VPISNIRLFETLGTKNTGREVTLQNQAVFCNKWKNRYWPGKNKIFPLQNTLLIPTYLLNEGK
jgi:hypothetical protein